MVANSLKLAVRIAALSLLDRSEVQGALSVLDVRSSGCCSRLVVLTRPGELSKDGVRDMAEQMAGLSGGRRHVYAVLVEDAMDRFDHYQSTDGTSYSWWVEHQNRRVTLRGSFIGDLTIVGQSGRARVRRRGSQEVTQITWGGGDDLEMAKAISYVRSFSDGSFAIFASSKTREVLTGLLENLGRANMNGGRVTVEARSDTCFGLSEHFPRQHVLESHAGCPASEALLSPGERCRLIVAQGWECVPSGPSDTGKGATRHFPEAKPR